MYLMLFLGFAVIGIFSYAPMYGLYMAFTNHKLGRPILSGKFVGLNNFKEFIMDSPDMVNLLRNTLGMNVLSLIVSLSGAMLLAILLNETRSMWFKKIVQTASFFPFFISWVIVYNICNVFLTVETGVLNTTLKDLGIIKEGINFMASPQYSWTLIVLVNLWKSLGYNSVLFLAAISGIEMELYQAANIDGADRLQKIWYITLPSLLPTLQVLLILNVGWIFSSNFGQFYLFTNTMNKPTMEVFDIYIYNYGIKQLNYSYATAVGIAKSLAGVVMLVLVNWTSKKINGKGVF
jgi:putative aldouronate transport system permease protein